MRKYEITEEERHSIACLQTYSSGRLEMIFVLGGKLPNGLGQHSNNILAWLERTEKPEE